jgi:hypothetical protein
LRFIQKASIVPIKISKRRNPVISTNCDIREFIAALKNKNFFETIYQLDKEATEAERLLFSSKSDRHNKHVCGVEYVSALKSLIFYIRYGARPKGLPEEYIDLFHSVCENNNDLWLN